MTGSDLEARALESLLGWYVAMGVDAPVDERPHDRFTEAEARRPTLRDATAGHLPPEEPPPNRPSTSQLSSFVGSTPTDTLVQQAKALAAGSRTLDELRLAWETLPGCGLAATAARMVFAGGNPQAKTMLLGGAPDSDDERHGEIFAGAQGRLLDAMLRAIGLDRRVVYLAYVVPWRPPGNRAPSQQELALCLPFALRHIALADPKVILCVGERAAQPILATDEPVGRLRGRWLEYVGDTKTVKTLVTFSPAYLLSQPLQKRRAWADLLMLEAALSS